MAEMNHHLDHSVWNDALIKGCDSKRLKAIFFRQYGFETDSDDKDEMQRALQETSAQLFNHLSELATLVGSLHENRAFKLRQAKEEVRLLINVEIKANSRLLLSERLINILQATDCKSLKNTRRQASPNEFSILFFQICKYKSFYDSSKLENVHIKFHQSTKEQLIEKYRKLGASQNEPV